MVPALELAEIVREARARTGVPGVAAALLAAGEVAAVADGVLELGREDPVRPDTPFRIASITKSFTATLVWETGGLTTRRRALLSHTAGYRPESCEPLPRKCAGLWSYSNAGYWEAVAHLAEYDFLLEKHVLDQLGLSSTGFETPPDAAWGHMQRGSTGHRSVDDLSYPASRRPGGGLWSTVTDLVTYGLAHCRGYTDLHEPVADALGASYACGWWVRDGLLDHEGSVGGYQSLLLLVPSREVVLAVLTNSWRGSGLIRRVVRDLGLAPGTPEVGADAADPESVVGRYRLDGVEAEVADAADGVLVEEAESDPVTGAPLSRRYPARPLGGCVYGFAGGALMSHRLDFPRRGVARIGWVAMPRSVP